MEQVSVYSRKDLASLWRLVKESFPKQAIRFRKNADGRSVLSVEKGYLSEFLKLFALWINKNSYQDEIKQVLLEYEALEREEREEVLCAAFKKAGEKKIELAGILEEKLKIIFENENSLNLKGFENFCMQEYFQKLEDLTIQSLDAYFSEQDYLEFLDLLRYFIEVEECRFGHLSIVVQADGGYQYYDERLKNITKDCMDKFLLEFEDENAEADDCLITILILLLPEKISLYGKEHIKNEKFLHTLENIFDARLKTFEGTSVFYNLKL